VPGAVVSSSGNVAWLATLGNVDFHGHPRPLRFTAVLERRGEQWQFRQVQFQWNDNDPKLGDLLRPSTYGRALGKLFARFGH
jgi:hypothetical protein